jgi:hypothetical protein
LEKKEEKEYLIDIIKEILFKLRGLEEQINSLQRGEAKTKQELTKISKIVRSLEGLLTNRLRY